MPVVLLERLPLPSLRAYTTISVTLLACAVHYASQVVSERRQAEFEEARKNASSNSSSNNSSNSSDVFDTGQTFITTAINVLLDETWCVWTLINMAYCCLVLVGKVIQGAVFGQLRVSEHQRVKDKFWNFVFYKFIFVFGVLNVQHMDEVMLWSAWFSMLGFLHLMSQLCKDRFEYLSFSPTTPGTTHAKVLLLLVSILAMDSALFVLCFLVGFMTGINIFAFMIAECALLAIRTLYVLVRYAIHLWDMHHDGVWENRALFVYWSEFSAEIASLSIDFSHHLHMLVWSNIFLSMASLVICMQLRYLFHEGQRRLRRHKNYLRVVNSMQARFPMASREEMDLNNDDCAICWDKMDSARKLPCSHLFHDSCLRSWLEQDTSCPTCRTSLSDPQDEVHQPTPATLAGVPGATPPLPGDEVRSPHHPTTNHFFHFDGSRYVSWFPSFSVEVTHTPILGNGPPAAQIQTSQLDNMARDVQSVFPGMPLNVITDDLRVTRSVEVTIENILEGVLVAPPQPSSSFSGTNGSGNAPSVPIPLDEPVTVIAPAPTLMVDHSTDPTPQGASSGGDVRWSLDHIVMSSNTNINFITDENIPDLTSDSDDEQYSASAPGTGSGARFSKSPVERHSMLMQRKESLLVVARRKFLDQNQVESGSESSDGDGSSQSTLSYHEDQADLDSLCVALCSAPSNNVTSAGEMSSYAVSEGMSEGVTSDDVYMRRERAYRAARRRMQQSSMKF